MIALARDWLNGLSASERVLIAVAAALAVVLGGTLFVVTPLREAHTDAQADYADAARLLAEARDGAAQAAARGASSGAVDVRAVATTSAVTRGLSIARMSPVDRGGLSVRLERADPALLYVWLADLDASYGVTVRRANIRRASGGDAVEADLVLGGASAS